MNVMIILTDDSYFYYSMYECNDNKEIIGKPLSFPYSDKNDCIQLARSNGYKIVNYSELTTMRNQVIDLLYSYYQHNDNFDIELLRWRNVYLNNVHISNIPFDDYEYFKHISDEELLNLLEIVIMRYNKQY
jgi:hypothetical protein